MKSSADDKSLFSDSEYNHIADCSEHLGIAAVWHEISAHQNPPEWRARFPSFAAKKEGFFWMLRRLLADDRVFFVSKLGNEPLTASSDELLSELENVFPRNEAELDHGIWFYMDDCPFGVDWRHH